MPGHLVAAEFQSYGLFRLVAQNGQVLHWLGLKLYIWQPFESPILPRKIQSFVWGCSMMEVLRPRRLVYFFFSSSVVMLRCFASISCSGLHIQMKPSSGPEQHWPHWVHSKWSPAIYHGSVIYYNCSFNLVDLDFVKSNPLLI